MSNKSTKFCSHCSSTVQPDDIFCNNCGASLDETIEPIESTPIHQQPLTQTTYPQQASVYVSQPRNLDSVAIVSLVFGIISVVTLIIPIVLLFGIVFGIVAVITGAISMKRTQKKYLAIIGLVLGVVDIVLWILFWTIGFRLYMFF